MKTSKVKLDKFINSLRRNIIINCNYVKSYGYHPEVLGEISGLDELQRSGANTAADIFGWKSLQPSDKDRNNSVVCATYIAKNVFQCDENSGNDKYNLKVSDKRKILPTLEGFMGLHDSIMNDSVELISVTGNRGSGKSHCVNYYIAKYFDELQKNKITFFRCDASKIKSIKIKGENISMEEYIRAHNYYVAIKHGGKDAVLKIFDRDCQKEDFSYTELLWSNEDSNLKKMHDMWVDLCKHPILYRINDNVSANEFISYVIERERSSIDYKITSQKMAMDMIARIKNIGGGVILFIDGVDNLSQEVDKRLYDNLMTEIVDKFFPKDNSGIYKKVVISLRNITFFDLKCRIPNSFTRNSHDVFVVGSIDPCELINHRIDDARNSKFDKSIFSSPDSWDKELKYFAKYFIKAMSDSLHRSSWEVLDIVFSGNIRSFTRNLILSYRYCRDFIENFNSGKKTPARLHLFFALSKEINLEASILGGAKFIPADSADEGDRPFGRWCPNMFHYFDDQRGDVRYENWDGLQLLRIMQLLSNKNRALTFFQIKKIIGDTFDYSENNIEKSFYKLLRYGLIYCKSRVQPEIGSSYELCYSRSVKGNILFEEIFKRPNLFYFFAISSAFPKVWLNNSRMVVPHNYKSSERHFYYSAIMTGVSFWCLLRCEHLRELNSYRRRIQKIKIQKKNQSERISEFLEIYKLPDSKEWESAVVRMFESLSENNSVDADNIIHDLEGLIFDRVG